GGDDPRRVAWPLLADLLLAGDGLLRALAGPGVGVGALPADGQAAAVAEPLVGADLHLPLDVLVDLAAEVALDLEALLDVVPDPGDLSVGEVAHPGRLVDVRRGADLLGHGPADSVDVGEGDDEALLPRDVDAGDSCHVRCSLNLPGS